VSLALMVWVGHTPALPGAARLSKWVGGRLGNLLAQAKTPSGSFAVGVLNGLLPCGAVYVALAGALGTAHPVSAAAFMAVFGLGTAPALLGMGWLSQRLSGQRLHRWSLGLTLATGLLLTVRGLGLGIPYLSPSVQGSIASAEHPACATDPSGGFSCCRPATSPAPAP
jgi:sulfite exporter TauE/SafE